MVKKLTQEEIEKRILSAHNGDIVVLGTYKNRRTKLLVKNIKCNHKWEAIPETVWNGHGCPICSGNIKKTTSQFKKEVYTLVGDEYTVLSEYTNRNYSILFRHNLCNREFKMTPSAFLSQKQRCPYERYIKSAKSNSMSFEEIERSIEKVGEGNYKIIGDYEKASKKVTFIHYKCNKTFEMSPSRFIKGGTRCPYCYRSKGEEVIRDYLKSNNYIFKEQYKIKECKNIRPLPFDFAIFDENKTLKCLIEYDGSQHFKPKFSTTKKYENFQKIKHNDFLKDSYCINNNIILIRIKYVRSENPNIFKSKLIQILEEKLNYFNMTITERSLQGNFRNV